MRIRVALGNARRPEYGVVTIPLPIPKEQYDSTIAMLDGLEIGAPLARDCLLYELQGPCPILKRLEGAAVNVDELDYLIRRLDSFTDGELAQFQGMAVKMGLNDMTDLIDLTFCCQQATVIADFSDLEAVGRKHFLELNGGCASMEELEQMDVRRTALELILNGEGAVTPYGVVYDNGMKLERAYDGQHLPCYYYGGDITFGDLMGSPDDLARWRQMVGEQIDEADSAISIFSLLNRSYYMAFIKYAALYLSEENLGQLLSNAWILNETPNQDPNISKRELVSLFRSISPQHLMDEEELRRYQELDDPVTVYRGVTSYNAGNVRALSWTLERKTEEWFAHRFGEKGIVYKAQIPKKHILAFFNNRGEAEVVLDPQHLKQVLESPKPEMGMRMT